MPFAITGPIPPREYTAEKVPALLDIASPLRTGLSKTTSGDLKLAGELATAEKLLWAAVLTPFGSVEYNPGFGFLNEHKRLRTHDIAAARTRLVSIALSVPYITEANVQITWDGDECFVAFDCMTDFGPFYSRRSLKYAA